MNLNATDATLLLAFTNTICAVSVCYGRSGDQSVVPSSSTAASAVAAVLGLDFTGLAVDVGLSCSPITAIGNNCGDTTVVCDAPKDEWGKCFHRSV
ncbi:hypothetical protein DFH08DRAFT_950304 [Mycena albidolilacea]|uniref:Hydrophobin n=1 Tax=Mycena albidolilacea TaxID=1033008 RepID=A0AAD7APU0_9AGAR|nr:hypothetical protein DFH08DRAFT_950304 [Mycena albidolilacea]